MGDSPAAGRTFYLVRREALASVLPSQVLTPLGRQPAGVRPRLGLLTPLGHLVRRPWRGKMRDLRRRAVEEYGVETDLLPSPPSRLLRLWDEARVVRRWVRRHAKDGPVVLHCRGPEATAVGLAVRDRDAGVRVVYDARGAVPEEFAQRLELEGHAVDTDAVAAVRETERRAVRHRLGSLLPSARVGDD